MGLFRNIFAGIFGSEMSKLGSMANQDPHFGRELKSQGISLTHEIQDLDKLKKAFHNAVYHHLAGAVKDNEERALKDIDKIIKHEDLAVGSSINIAQMLVRTLREIFKQDVLISQHGFSPAVAKRLEQEVQARLAKLANDLNRIGNIFIQVSDDARGSA